MAKIPVTLQLQIPFCSASCSFCTKRRIPGWDTARLSSYAAALARELSANGEAFADCQVQAVRITGGNATALTGEDLWLLYTTLQAHYDLSGDVPVTILASPFQISGGRLAFYNRVPIRRYDYELFSLDSGDAAWLNRPDATEKLRWAANMTHAGETGSMGAVLLLGHPDQTQERFHRSLTALLRHPVSHLALWRHPAAGEREITSADRSTLQTAGFREYLPRRWAKPGGEDRYSLLRAAGTDTLAFGLGAVTRFAGARSENTMDLDTYLAYADDFAAITLQAGPAEA